MISVVLDNFIIRKGYMKAKCIKSDKPWVGVWHSLRYDTCDKAKNVGSWYENGVTSILYQNSCNLRKNEIQAIPSPRDSSFISYSCYGILA